VAFRGSLVAVAPDGAPATDEGAAAMNLLADRLAAMGATMADVAELRVYRVEGEAGFNAEYGAHSNSAASPRLPVRTNYLVESLPNGRVLTAFVRSATSVPARSLLTQLRAKTPAHP
jgi:enamine deaminase RidA (YjgF/YER057c/UK114 family)